MKLLVKIIVLVLFPLIAGKAVHLQFNHSGEGSSEISVAYPGHIAGPYTGGFGEQSCHSCHFDYDVNQPGGELSISGIGEDYKPGEKKEFTITVKREDMGRAGFQLTARFEDGTQAGQFELHESLTTTPNIDNDVTYVQHGVGKVQAENGEKNWMLTWIAPGQKAGPIIFNIAANAANGDASEFGDWIYVKEFKVQ